MASWSSNTYLGLSPKFYLHEKNKTTNLFKPLLFWVLLQLNEILKGYVGFLRAVASKRVMLVRS